MIKTLLIGLGNIGMGYDLDKDSEDILTHAKAIVNTPGMRLVGAVESNSEKRHKFEISYELETYQEVGEAIKKTDPVLVVIAIPTKGHIHLIKEICKHESIKYILCEKPMGDSYTEAKVINNICKRKGIEIWVNYIRRTDAGVREIKNIIKEQWRDSYIKGCCWYSKGIKNNGSHFIDLGKYWLGEIKSMKKIGTTRKLDSFTETDFCIEYEKGSLVFQYAWEEAFTHYTIELLSNKGRIFYNKGGEEIEIQGLEKNTLYKGEMTLGEKISINNSMKKYQLKIYEQLMRRLQGGECDLCTGEEAMSYHWYIDNMMSAE